MWAVLNTMSGLKIASRKSVTMMRPPSRVTPAGDCIQELATMIQNTERADPSTTMQVEKKWSFGGTRFQPKTMTPRNPASSMKAARVSVPRISPKKALLAAKGAQLFPKANSRGRPVTTPMPKFSSSSRLQKRAWPYQAGSFVLSQRPSMTAMNRAVPTVSTEKEMWTMAMAAS